MNTPKTTKFTLKRIIENLGNIPNKGFSEETPKLSPDQKKKLMEMASMFESFGSVLGQEESIANSARSMMEFCNLAESYAVNECGDYFQQEIVGKDMKHMKQKAMEYQKVSQECYSGLQKLGVLYDDIRHVAERYYDLESIQEIMPSMTQATAQKPTSMHPITNEATPPSGMHDPMINPPLSSANL